MTESVSFRFGSPEMLGTAEFSHCLKYRYALTRTWSRDPGRGRVAWIMLNPSIADAEKDDPTIRRCISFSQFWGAGGLTVVNLFALRSTDPSELEKHYHAASRQPENDEAIVAACSGHRIIAAWGSHRMVRGRDRQVWDLLQKAYPDRSIECLGLTNGGHPRHPLYVKHNAETIEFGSDWSSRGQ